LYQMRGHRLPHDAQANKTNNRFHADLQSRFIYKVYAWSHRQA
jgi:hypothetical protein